MTGTLTCTTTAVGREPGRRRTRSATAAGLADDGFNVVYDYANCNYTVTKAPLTVTADNKSRLFGQAEPAADGDAQRLRARPDARPPRASPAGGVHDDGDAVQPGRRLPDHLHAGHARRGELQLRPVRPGHAHGRRTRSRASPRPARRRSRWRGPGDLHRPGRRDQRADHGRARAARSTSRAATIAGSIRSTGATAFRMCGAQMSGPLTVTRHDRARADRRRRGHRAVRRQHAHRPGVDHRQHGGVEFNSTASPARSRSPATRAACRRRTPARCTRSATRSSARARSSQRGRARGGGVAPLPRLPSPCRRA